MNDLKVSVIVPCFNEEKTIEQVLLQILNQKDIINEVIVVDDKSTDNSRQKIENMSNLNPKIQFFFKDKNEGKGSALIKGFSLSKGDIVLIQDADLEYDPEEYKKLIKPFIESNADVVYGSRFLGGDMVRLHFFWHYLANKILTFICNLFTNLNLTDMETGYKVFKSSALKSISLKEQTFSFEPEVTIKLSKKKFKFFEVPITYNGRSYDEGKKIGLKDAFIALKTIILYTLIG